MGEITKNIPVCRTCPYMSVPYRAMSNRNNNGNPRGNCYCKHPYMKKSFFIYCGSTPTRSEGFIGFTKMGGNIPQIKTSPRWCPLRGEKIQEVHP